MIREDVKNIIVEVTDKREIAPLDTSSDAGDPKTVAIGRKSLKIVLLLGFPVATLSYTVFLSNFLYMAPKHQCRNERKANHSQTQNLTFDPKWQCHRPADVRTNMSLSAESCPGGWDYDLSLGPNVVTELNLVCDDAWKRPTIMCVFFASYTFGSLLGGSFSDKFGRRMMVRTSILMEGVFLMLLSFAQNYIVYICINFMAGFFNVLAYFSIFLIVQESVPENKRVLAALGINLSSGLGMLFVPLASYFVMDWRWLIRISSISRLAYFPFIVIFVKESPLWLEEKRRNARTGKNKKDDPRKRVSMENANEFIAKRESLRLSLFCTNSVMRSRILISCFLWNVSFLSFYTLCLNSANLGGNIYLNCVFGALVDMASYIFISMLLHRSGRRSSSSLCIFISAAFCLLTPPLRNVNETLGVASSLLGRFFVTGSMSIVVLYTGELFPTLLRNTSVGIASMTSRVGSALSPYLIFSGEMLDVAIPFYVMGGLAMLAACLILVLPETSNTALPVTLQDAIDLNKFRLRRIRRTTTKS